MAQEQLLSGLNWRIRDVRVGADGNVYALTDDSNGRVLRIEPPTVTPRGKRPATLPSSAPSGETRVPAKAVRASQ